MARLRRSPALWLLLAAAVVVAAHVAAEVFTVSSTADSGPGSLRDAIAQANALPGADKVVFDPALTGQPIVLTTDQLTVTDHLTITGLGQDLLTIERSTTAPEFRIFKINDGTATDIPVRISGMTISGGLAYSQSGGIAYSAVGGAILNSEDLVIEDSTVSGNSALNAADTDGFARGGAIFNRAALTLRNSTISSNSASTTSSCSWLEICWAAGGGIYSTSDGQVTLLNSSVSDNTASAPVGGYPYGGAYAYGGAIDSRGNLCIRDSVLSGNNALSTWNAHGGAVRSDTSLDIRTSTISGNTVFGMHRAYGGGISSAGVTTLVDTTVSSNLADLDGDCGVIAAGGGIKAGNGQLTLIQCTISNNTVSSRGSHQIYAYGGGIDAWWWPVTISNISNSTIHANWVTAAGGWPYCYALGGGIRTSDVGTHDTSIASTIVEGNSASASGLESGDDAYGEFDTAAYNLIGDPYGNDIPIGSYGNISGDPQLGPLQDNGGPTLTHAIPSDSIAVDAGSNPAGLPTDQRWYGPREVNGVADIGAFEYGASPIPGLLFADGFEAGDVSRWSAAVVGL